MTLTPVGTSYRSKGFAVRGALRLLRYTLPPRLRDELSQLSQHRRQARIHLLLPFGAFWHVVAPGPAFAVSRCGGGAERAQTGPGTEHVCAGLAEDLRAKGALTVLFAEAAVRLEEVSK